MGIALVVGGVLLIWLATEAGWFGLDAESVQAIPLRPILIGFVILAVVWLWRRRAKWH